MKRLFSLLSNKYFLASASFLVWMLFFDRNDFMSQYEYHSQLTKLKAEKEFYTLETAKAITDLKELTTNPKTLEKFAREKYLMKKDNEDVFVIVKEEPKKQKNSLF
ncbi:MAG: septum formation initiator family protein [Daejeonella sp.]